ncbi:phage head morphogenesis protein [Aeromonas caviae]|uniref:phage head morphogenesis protein n=1 Tax=Aeromonas caviae TaxID=648 RepID=UPI0038D0CB04
MVNHLTLQESLILKCRVAHALACLEEVDTVTLAYVKSLEALCDQTSRREVDEARKELGELWSAAYAKADKKALAYLDKNDVRIERAAAQWQRLQSTKRHIPYLLYRLGPRQETCELHLKWDNILLLIDDPWWSSHMPPNGWGCTCSVRGVSKHEYEQLIAKGQVKTTASDDGVIQWTNPRTGEVENIPHGIDPSWNFNPGIGRKP